VTTTLDETGIVPRDEIVAAPGRPAYVKPYVNDLTGQWTKKIRSPALDNLTGVMDKLLKYAAVPLPTGSFLCVCLQAPKSLCLIGP